MFKRVSVIRKEKYLTRFVVICLRKLVITIGWLSYVHSVLEAVFSF